MKLFTKNTHTFKRTQILHSLRLASKIENRKRNKLSVQLNRVEVTGERLAITLSDLTYYRKLTFNLRDSSHYLQVFWTDYTTQLFNQLKIFES